MKTNARPGLNGNTPADFTEAARAMFDTASTAKIELTKAIQEPFNARNYQHSRQPTQDRETDRERIRVIYTALRDLEALAVELYDIGRGQL